MENSILKDIKKIFDKDSSGHDYWHTFRVYKNAMRISEIEGGNRQVIELAALLHDVDDEKLFDTKKYLNATNIMNKYNIDCETQRLVISILKEVSYRGCDSSVPKTLEGKIVQDADRLEAMGAIGIARTFAYGGSRGQCLYDPSIKPKVNINGAQYLEGQGTSINHFYEKLLLLKNLMNTKSGKKIAEKRDEYMRCFLDEFYREIDEVVNYE